jgi:hypothetical protein
MHRDQFSGQSEVGVSFKGPESGKYDLVPWGLRVNPSIIERYPILDFSSGVWTPRDHNYPIASSELSSVPVPRDA